MVLEIGIVVLAAAAAGGLAVATADLLLVELPVQDAERGWLDGFGGLPAASGGGRHYLRGLDAGRRQAEIWHAAAERSGVLVSEAAMLADLAEYRGTYRLRRQREAYGWLGGRPR